CTPPSERVSRVAHASGLFPWGAAARSQHASTVAAADDPGLPTPEETPASSLRPRSASQPGSDERAASEVSKSLSAAGLRVSREGRIVYFPGLSRRVKICAKSASRKAQEAPAGRPGDHLAIWPCVI